MSSFIWGPVRKAASREAARLFLFKLDQGFTVAHFHWKFTLETKSSSEKEKVNTTTTCLIDNLWNKTSWIFISTGWVTEKLQVVLPEQSFSNFWRRPLLWKYWTYHVLRGTKSQCWTGVHQCLHWTFVYQRWWIIVIETAGWTTTNLWTFLL